MSTFSATLNAGTSNASKLVYGGATNTLVVTESSPPSDPFSSSTTVSLSYSTPGVTYNFSSVSITSFTSTTLTVTFQVSATGGSAAGGSQLKVSTNSPLELLFLQVLADQ